MSGTSGGSAGRVLVAEDTEVISYVMTELLVQAGYEVQSAQDGEECLLKVASFKPDLLILDLMMPKVHGIEVLKRLRADPETQDLGVIVCTAKTFKTEHSKAMELGALGFLPKPVTKDSLLWTVGAFFAGALKEQSSASDMSALAVPMGEPYRPTLEAEHGKLTLWGTRGSIPTPGPQFLRHGGNTSCMSLEVGEEIFIFDAGSGIRDLGNALMKGPPRKLHLFITHTHWDHIQGFPFFTPAYVPGFEVTVYGAEGFGKSLEGVFHGQLDQDYFPVQMEDLNANIEFRHLADDGEQFGHVEVSWEYAQHPGATVGYKIDVGGKTVAWFPDDEFLHGYIGSPEDVQPFDAMVSPYRRAIDFLKNADILIHEAQYTNEEYPTHVGWGHSSVSNACLLASFAEVKRWIVTHHDPIHDDAFLETKINLTRQQLARLGHDIPVSHGYDGMTVYL
jgi:CheY-like chemotaxis protein